MSDRNNDAYDDEGNVIHVRYAPLPEHYRRKGSIRPVSAEEMPLIRQRNAEKEAERERQEAQARAERMKQAEEKRAALVAINSPLGPKKRALQLDDQSED